MTDTDLKKLRVIDGHKVNHPHSGLNISYAILTIVFAAFPLLFLFLPVVANDPGANGIDTIKYGIDVLNYLSNGQALPPDTNDLFRIMISLMHPDVRYASAYLFVFLTALIFAISLLSVAIILLGIIHLAKGYLRRPGAVVILSAVQLFFSLAFLTVMIFNYYWVKDFGHQDLAVWFMVIPCVIALFFVITFGVLNSAAFTNSVLESEIEQVKLEEPKPQPKPVEKKVAPKTEEQLSTIPADVTSIGGHAYAENQSLTVANIPLQITKLGAGAFANCLSLKVVSLPTSVKEIGRNCFFNCASLERINYGGTKEQWSKIKRGSNWLARAKTTEVVCSDSVITVNPYK